MKVEINNVEALSLTEVVDQLVGCGALQIPHDKKLGESRLECGCDLDIDIMENDPSDPRIDGCLSHTEEFTLSDIREHFTQCEWYAWAKDEDGNDILLCFNRKEIDAMKIREIKSVQEWTADVAKKLHPYSKTLKAVDWYFATAGYDDVNVEWSRAFNGYSNDHFTPETLAEFYKAAKVEISGNYSITIYDN